MGRGHKTPHSTVLGFIIVCTDRTTEWEGSPNWVPASGNPPYGGFRHGFGVHNRVYRPRYGLGGVGKWGLA